MTGSLTKDIHVTVKTQFNSRLSDVGNYVFSYHITIINRSNFSVKLLRRHWDIIDSNGQKQVVEGEGVVGRQPILEPGQKHQYVSGCNFESDMGMMSGYYLMERLVDGNFVRVEIPKFTMVANFRRN